MVVKIFHIYFLILLRIKKSHCTRSSQQRLYKSKGSGHYQQTHSLSSFLVGYRYCWVVRSSTRRFSHIIFHSLRAISCSLRCLGLFFLHGLLSVFFLLHHKKLGKIKRYSWFCNGYCSQ